MTFLIQFFLSLPQLQLLLIDEDDNYVEADSKDTG